MKILDKILIVAICLSMCYACSYPGEDLTIDLKSGELGADKSHETQMVTTPFKADFTVWRSHPMGEGEPCDIGLARETMAGEGEITHLGEISTFMTFCVNSSFGYSFTELGYFIAANGDILYIDIPVGQIYPGADKEGYHAHFNDTIYFSDGTGRFEGATGKALTNAYVHMDTDDDGPDEFRTDFFSEGTLTLIKGNR